MESKVIFVGGAPRSGTTLVQRCLNAHHKIYGGGEFDHIDKIVNLRNILLRSVKKGRISSYFDKNRLDSKIVEMIDSLLLPVAQAKGCEIISEKTPKNILIFDDLIQIYPNARYVYVVRDPRSVVNSMKNVAKKRGKWESLKAPDHFISSVHSSVKYFIRCNACGLKSITRHPDTVFQIVYEEFVNDPVRATKKLCEFLRIEWDPRMVHPEEVVFERAATGDTPWYSEQSIKKGIESDVVEKWEKGLTNFEKNYISYKIRVMAKYEHWPYRLDYKKFYVPLIFLYDSLIKLIIFINYMLRGILTAYKKANSK